MDTPVYTATVTIGGKSQTTKSKIGTVLPRDIITRQSGQLVITAVDAAGDPFDLSGLGTLDLKAGVFDSAEASVTLGTGAISGAGNNIFTASWVRDTIPAGWSQFAFDKEGVVVIYIELQETGTADYFEWSTRVNVDDGDFTGSATVIPLGFIFYYNPTYEYDNTIAAAADPGAGKFRMDAVTLSSVTEFYISDTNQSNVDLQTYWQALGVGSHIYLNNPNVKLEGAYFTISGTPTNGTGFTTVPVTYVDAGTTQFTNGSQFSYTLDGVASSTSFGIAYDFDSTITDADPGAGSFRLNNAAPASATFIYVADDDKGGVNNSAYLQSLKTGDFIRFGEIVATTAAASYTVSGAPTNATGYTKIPVTYVDAGAGSFTNGNECSFFIDSKAGDLVNDTSPQLGGILDTNSHQVRWSKGADVASAASLTLGTDGNYFDITGTTTITSIATLAVGTEVKLHFDAALTLTHNATDLILPGGANVTTAAGDEFTFVEYAAGDWRCTSYALASGEAIVGGSGGGNFPTSTDSGDKTTAYSIVAGDENTTIVAGSATTADFAITYDVSLWTTAGSVLTVRNESSYIVEVVVSNTSTMQIDQGTNKYVSPGETLTMAADTSTQVWTVARS